jgi:endonuclease/exonuclease/phosphatase family metal-dependent hydrolase
LLVRAWNLFHGNTVPPGRRAFLREMVELVTADRPDIVFLQEVPVWAFGELTAWSGMRALPAVAMTPQLGPVPIPAGLGKALTASHHGVIRSAFAGQGNAILLAPGLAAGQARTEILTAVDSPMLLGWRRQRRVAQLVDAGGFRLANVHLTSVESSPHAADDELAAVAAMLGDGPAIIAGDLNLRPERSRMIQALTGPDGGFSAPGPRIDHILVRGAAVSSLRVWPDEERVYGGRLLSDHAPLELTVAERA